MADNIELTGKIIITGANSGIGLALAKRLKDQKLILIDRDTEALKAFSSAQIIKADLTKSQDIDNIISQVDGRVKVLVNNAGVGFKGGISDLPAEKLLTMIQVNILAPMLLTKKLGRILKRDQAHVLNTGSSVAYNPLPGMSVYAATKAFLVSWSEALAYEWRETNQVTTLSPSGTATGFQKAGGVSTEHGKLMSPEQVAQIMQRAIQGKGSHTILGAASIVLIMICRFLPIRKATKIWGGLFAGLR